MDFENNINKMKTIYFLHGMAFFSPVVVLFWLANGLNMAKVMLLQSIYSIFIVAFQFPTGYFADVYGRKMSIFLGNLLYFLGIFVYSIGNNFIQFAIAEILLAIGFSFFSGADSALIYESLMDLKREKEYKKVLGNLMFYSSIAAIIGNVVGGFIGKINLRLTLYAILPFLLISVIISLMLKEPKKKQKPKKESIFHDLKNTMKNKNVLFILIYFSLLGTLIGGVLWFYQPYFKICGIDVAYFGIIFAMFNIIYALSAKYAYIIEKKIGIETSLIIMPVILSMSYFLMGSFVFYFSFIFAFLQQFLRGFSGVILSDYLNKLVSSEIRASVLSVKNMLYHLFYASLLPILGYIADLYSLFFALNILGILSLFLVFLPLIVKIKYFKR